MAFDREHLRLLTDKLSEKAGDLRSRQRAAARADQHRPGARLRARRRPAASECVCVGADLFGATYVTLGILDRHDRTVQHFVTCGAAIRSVDRDRRRSLGHARHGRRRAPHVARRQSRRRSRALQLPAGHPKIAAFLAAPFASPAHVYGWICLVGNEGRTLHRGRRASGHGALGAGRPHLRARTRNSRAQAGRVGAAPRTRPGAALPGHRRSHPARARPRRTDHA